MDGKVGPITLIDGEYYTVNVSRSTTLSPSLFLIELHQPQAIRTALDVYGENVRKIFPVDSPTFGRVFNVCIGAMMVGSVNFTVNEGDTIARGQEFGYFAFGTS